MRIRRIIKTLLFVLSLVLVFVLPNKAYAASSETESNNTSATANLISVNSSISGNLSSSSDIDWYKFTTTEDGYFNVSFNHTVIDSSGRCWRIYLYDSTAVNNIDGTSGYYYFTGNKGEGTTRNFGITAGTYYVKISDDSYYSGVDYNLTVNFSEATDWEIENNNNSTKANDIELYKEKKGSLSLSGDVDWYKLIINSTCEIQITLNHTVIDSSSVHWYIYLYDSTAVTQLLKFGRKGSTESGSSEFIPVTPGIYYIKISDGIYYSGVNYSLFVSEQHEHVGNWVSKVDPTCTDTGIEERTCTRCGTKEERETPALGHDFSNGLVTIKEATCTEKGLQECTCSRCGHKETSEVDALGHKYVVKEESKSSIMKQGETIYECTRCGDVYTKKDKSNVWIFPTLLSIELVAFALFLIIKKVKY